MATVREPKLSKRLKTLRTKVDRSKLYPVDDALKLDKGSAKPHLDKVGKLTRAQVEEIAKTKQKDLTGADLNAAVRTIAGTARSMGITVEGVV